MYKAKIIDGKLYLCDKEGNIVPKQIDVKLNQRMDEGDAKMATMEVTLWVSLDD